MKRAASAILCMVFMSLCITQDTTLPAQNTPPASPELPVSYPFGICTNPQLYPYLPKLGAFWTFTGIVWEDVEPEQDVWTFEKTDQIITKAKNNNITLIVKIRTGTC